MIYDGVRGYLSGDLSQATGTVLAMTKGPIKGRNWMATTVNPAYSITMTTGTTGTVKLQGTNDYALKSASGQELNAVEKDILPTEGATWTDIQAATAVSASGTFSLEYAFLRLVVAASGTGYVLNAWVRWN